jgi:serine O-acetyltransferase
MTNLTAAARRHYSLFVEDAARWPEPQGYADPASLSMRDVARLLYHHVPLRAIAWFRLASLLREIGVRGAPGMIQRRMMRVFGLELSAGAEIGGGLYIAHPVGVVIQAERIGRNATVIAGVTVGYRQGYHWPRLGDDVYLGAGCRVIGDVELGSGARIGANAVVLRDVPAGATAVGVPANARTPGAGPGGPTPHGAAASSDQASTRS